MKLYNNEKYIISFTSFGCRFNNAALMVFSLLKQRYHDVHIVCTIYQEDLNDLSEQLATLIDHNIIELIVAPKNLCPHLKYYYTMLKYWDKPIITVDDDRVYTDRTIELLVNKYESLMSKSVISTCAPQMKKHGRLILTDTEWCVGENRLRPNASSYIAMAEGFGGVLYPSKCFQDLESLLPEIQYALYHDDLFLRVAETRQHIPVTQINGTYGIDCAGIQQPSTTNNGLKINHNLGDEYRNRITAHFNDDLLKGFYL